MDTSHEPESFRGLLRRHRGRTRLTQRDLAALVGVSVQSVQDWEAGLSFPAAARLQQLIRVFLGAGALTPGRERSEARELWLAAEHDAPRMRSPFDEQWFAELVAAYASARRLGAETPLDERMAAEHEHSNGPFGARAHSAASSPRTATDELHTLDLAEPAAGTTERHDWGEAPDTSGFVGRAEELALLRRWVVDERRRLVAVLGFGGIGKTALAGRLAQTIASGFERVYWRTLHTPRPVSEWLAGAIAFLSENQVVPPASESEGINALLYVLRTRRCLLVLDNVDTLFEPGQGHSPYRTGMDGYGRLLQAVGDTAHQSCLLFTSREAPSDLVSGTEATPLLVAAARRLESLDVSFARETYLDAFSAALFGARLNDTVGLLDVAQAVRAAPRPSAGESTAADLLLDALVALTSDYESAIPLCRAALQKLTGDRTSAKERLRWLWQGCVLALEAWDDESAYVLSHHSVQTARDTGTLGELALALSARAPVLVFCGEFSAAASAVVEGQSVEQATGITSAPYGALILAAWRGDAGEARELIETTTAAVGSRGEGIGIAICEYARAVLCNGLGQYEEALAAARSASQYREVVAENWGLCELIESATRVGRTDLATDGMIRLATKARAAAPHWARGIEARSRALLGQGDRAEDAFREAIDHLRRTRVRAELARTRLLYGEWLRREHRLVDARVQLRAAHDELTAVGMEAFAERARNELLATGEQVRARAVDQRDKLTAEEGQVARLARDGLSNADIGARLFLSPQTVEWHLSNAFTKLGINSRAELANALASTGLRPALA